MVLAVSATEQDPTVPRPETEGTRMIHHVSMRATHLKEPVQEPA